MMIFTHCCALRCLLRDTISIACPSQLCPAPQIRHHTVIGHCRMAPATWCTIAVMLSVMKLISTQQSICSYHSCFKLFISSILRPKHLYSHQTDKYPLIHSTLQLFYLHTQQPSLQHYPISTDTSINH